MDSVEDPDSSVRALVLGHRALRDFSSGRFQAALETFTKADELAHSPVFVLYRARSAQALDRLLEARSLYLACSTEAMSQSAPESWLKAQGDAARELSVLRAMIPRLHLTLRGGARFPVWLTDGERRVAIAEAEMVVELDPGLHHLTVTDAAGSSISVLAYASRGDRGHEVVFEFSRRSEPQTASQGAGVRGSSRSAPGVRPVKKGAIAAFSLGGAAFVFSGVTFGIASSKASALKDDCPQRRCSAADLPRAQAAERMANLATAGVVAGLVGAATGGLLWALDLRTHRKSENAKSERFLLEAGMAGVSMRGAF
jgi:hypothetical protein